MKLQNLFGAPSIRRRISSAFLIVTVFVVALVTASYLQLRQVRPFSNLIIHDSSDLVGIQRLSSATTALDADFERYLLIRGAEYRDNVQQDLQDMVDSLALLQRDSIAGTEATLSEIETIIASLQEKIIPVLDTNLGSSSSSDLNRLIVAVYNDIDQVKLLQDELSAKTLTSLQDTAQAQGLIADNVLTQSVVLGVIVSLIAVITTILTDRRLRTISSLTETAVAISNGDLSRVAQVESRDEIGTLSASFNAMTSQLRDLIGSLEQRVAERTRALSSVAEVSTAASTILETDKLLQKVVDLSKERFGFYHAHIYLLNESGDTLVLASGAGEPGRQMVAKGHAIPLDREQSLVARAAREKKGVTVNDVTQAPDFLPNPLLPNTRSELAVPMMVGEQVIGVFDVQSETVGRFTDSDIAVQTTLASQVASAVQNARSFTLVEQQRRQNDLILGSAGEGIFGLDEKGNHTFINPAAAEMLGYTIEELIGKHSHSTWHHTHADGTPFPSEECPIYFTVNKGIRNEGEEYFIRKDGTGFHVRFSSKPILQDDRVVGAVVTFADITQQKQDREVIAQRARQQEALNLITQKIQSADTVETALQVAARELGRALGQKPTLVTLDVAALAGENRTAVAE